MVASVTYYDTKALKADDKAKVAANEPLEGRLANLFALVGPDNRQKRHLLLRGERRVAIQVAKIKRFVKITHNLYTCQST